MIIAITGGIGSGKSSVSRVLAALANAEVCDTDIFCKNQLEKNRSGWLGVVKKWGNLYLNDDGAISRPLLREAIFVDEQKRVELEEILHPLVKNHIKERISKAKRNQKWLLVEIPLLFETGWQNDFDYVITVFAESADCIERVEQRDGVSREQVIRIIASQMDIEEKKRLADYVIDNSGTPSETKSQVEDLFSKLQENKPLKKSK